MADRELSVIAPCFNEEGNVSLLVERLLATFKQANINGEIVLVNDASRDRTGEIIEELAVKHPEVVPCHHPKNLGIEGGWNTGVANAKGELLCFIDSDLQNRPEDVARLYRALMESRADIVQGWRSSAARKKDSRFLLSKGLNILLNLSFGMHAKDNKSGFIMARKPIVEDILSHRFSYYCYQSMMMVAANARKYSVHEIETTFDNRHAGQSFIPSIPWKITLKCLSDLITGFVEFQILKKAPRPRDPLPPASETLKEVPEEPEVKAIVTDNLLDDSL